MSEEQIIKQPEEIPIPSELVQVEQTTQGYLGIKTTFFKDPLTGFKHVIPTALSPNPTVDRIINYAERTSYVGLLNIGMSGTGKSTWTTWLIHQLHMRKQFQVHWHYRDDVKYLDQHIKKLQKGISHIIVYDDASFVFDQLSKEEITNLAKHLTYIRHDVGGTVIIIMNIHYNTAVKKFFRNVPFKFLTSITMDEVFTLSDIYKYGKYKFLNFARYFQSMMFTGQWTFELNKWRGKGYTYHTDKPFRLGLALEGNYVHFFFYLRDGCAICDPRYDIKKITSPDELVQIMTDKYQWYKATRIIRLYSFAIHGLKVIPSKDLSAFRTLAKLDQANEIDWIKVNELIDKSKPRSRTYIKSNEIQDNVNDINETSIDYEKEVKEPIEEQELQFNQDIQDQMEHEQISEGVEEAKDDYDEETNSNNNEMFDN